MDKKMDPEYLDFYNNQKHQHSAQHHHQQQQQVYYKHQHGPQCQAKQAHSQHDSRYHAETSKHSHSHQQQQQQLASYNHQQQQLQQNQRYQQMNPSAAHSHHPPHQLQHSNSGSSAGSAGSTSTVNSSGTTSSGTSLKAVNLQNYLKTRHALLPGGRDRRGGPLLCFPMSKSDPLPPEKLALVVRYLTFLPCDRVRKLGFTVIIDMRGGPTGSNVKTILKVLDEYLGDDVHVTFIIKPDKFLEKQKANMMAIGKHKFEVSLISRDSLYAEVDPSQLTSDFEGSLPYNLEEWIIIRCRLESFFSMAHAMYGTFMDLKKSVDCTHDDKTLIKTVDAVNHRLEEYRSYKPKILQTPVHVLEEEAQKMCQWLKAGISSSQHSAGSEYLGISWVCNNADFQESAPLVSQTAKQLYELRAQIMHSWESGKTRLEQIYTKCLFDDDSSSLSKWFEYQKDSFLVDFHHIGQTASQAADLHADHLQFLTRCTIVKEQVTRLCGVAKKLSETGHYARDHIVKVANQLDHEWSSLNVALEDRSNVLQLSASFHSRAEAFLANCPHWESMIDAIQANTASEHHQALITLQDLFDEAHRANEEVKSDGQALVKHLTSPVPRGSHSSLTAMVNYSEGRDHCTALMHELLGWYERLERIYIYRKQRISHNLNLLSFMSDVAQVYAWLSDHGHPFLMRQTFIGKSQQRAEVLYNAHMQFEQIAANTLTNADKLITNAEEIVANAENPKEIYQKSAELRSRINNFTQAVNNRREILDLACGFYAHTKDLFGRLHNVRQTFNTNEYLPGTIEGVEEADENFNKLRLRIEHDSKTVMNEGRHLIQLITDPDEKNHVKNLLDQVQAERTAANDLLMDRKVRLDLCMQLRLFEADVRSAMEILRQEVPQPGTPLADDPTTAPTIDVLENGAALCHNGVFTAEEVLQKGEELAIAFESVNVNFPAGSPGSESSLDSGGENAVERIQRLINELSEVISDVDELRVRITGELDWRRLEEQTRNVLHWISNCEMMLRTTAVIPANLTETEQLSVGHERFRTSLSDTHAQAISCTAKGEMMLSGMGSENPRTRDIREATEKLSNRWTNLVFAAEERQKLLAAANNWYKTAEQVTQVLTCLEKDYRREGDWCHSENALAKGDPDTFLKDTITRHNEQKESFLKACILARRTSDSFTRYINRQPLGIANKQKVEELNVTGMHHLMANEQRLLEAWAARKKRLDECVNFLAFKTEVEKCLSRPSKVPDTPELAEEVQVELRHLIAKGDQLKSQTVLHADPLTELVTRLTARLQLVEPSTRIKTKIATAIRESKDSGFSDSSMVSDKTSVSSVTSVLTDQQTKMARRREKILNELIQTEKTYVHDMKQCLDAYYQATIASPSPEIQIPTGIKGREATIFCNMSQIYTFHRDTFSVELEKYIGDFLPEDVGHCFVRHGDTLAALYVNYCVNNVESTQLVIDESGNFYQEVQSHYGLSEPLQSYLIKPVQRITKYQLILRELLDCCDPGSAGELREGMETMLGVPKKANDGLHLSMLQGVPEDSVTPAQGDLLLQDQFMIWEPKQLIKKKGHKRRVFLFDVCLLITKEMPSLPGEHKARYQFKSRILLGECNITEHIEGDQCKFALWTGHFTSPDNKIVMKTATLEVKQTWVRALREAMQERMGHNLYPGKTDNDDFFVLEDYKATGDGELSVSVNQRVEMLNPTSHTSNPASSDMVIWSQVRVVGPGGVVQEGCVPSHLLGRRDTPAAGPTGGGRRGSTQAVKKWLLKDRKTGGKRGSKADQVITPLRAAQAASLPNTALPPTTAFSPQTLAQPSVQGPVANGASAVNPPTSLVTDICGLDNVSEESVEVELPPPMQLQEIPAAVPPPSSTPAEMGEARADAEGSRDRDSGEMQALEGSASSSTHEDRSDDQELSGLLENTLRLSRRSRRNAEESAQRRARPHAIIQDEWSPSPLPPGEIPLNHERLCDGGGDENDEKVSRRGGGQKALEGEERALIREKRRQVILQMLLVETAYVENLNFIKDKYMPALDMNLVTDAPDDLVNQWSLIWSNLLQLCEWHSTFHSRLSQITHTITAGGDISEEEEDQHLDCLPKLFLDYASKLKSMYSKYSENYRRALHLTRHQYAHVFTDLRERVEDSYLDGVSSRLGQPVDHIIRYQHHLSEYVRHSHCLGASGAKEEWTKAVELMRTIPHQTQLILEMSRIEGYPGKLSSLGELRRRGDLGLSLVQSGESQTSTTFLSSRLFLFDNYLLITETQDAMDTTNPIAITTNTLSSDCTYQFKHALDINTLNTESSNGSLRFSATAISSTNPKTSHGDHVTFVIDSSHPSQDIWMTHFNQLQKMRQLASNAEHLNIATPEVKKADLSHPSRDGQEPRHRATPTGIPSIAKPSLKSPNASPHTRRATLPNTPTAAPLVNSGLRKPSQIPAASSKHTKPGDLGNGNSLVSSEAVSRIPQPGSVAGNCKKKGSLLNIFSGPGGQQKQGHDSSNS